MSFCPEVPRLLPLRQLGSQVSLRLRILYVLRMTALEAAPLVVRRVAQEEQLEVLLAVEVQHVVEVGAPVEVLLEEAQLVEERLEAELLEEVQLVAQLEEVQVVALQEVEAEAVPELELEAVQVVALQEVEAE